MKLVMSSLASTVLASGINGNASGSCSFGDVNLSLPTIPLSTTDVAVSAANLVSAINTSAKMSNGFPIRASLGEGNTVIVVGVVADGVTDAMVCNFSGSYAVADPAAWNSGWQTTVIQSGYAPTLSYSSAQRTTFGAACAALAVLVTAK